MKAIDCGDLDFGQEIVGEASYQETIRKMISDSGVADTRKLVLFVEVMCDPTNRFDKTAVRVANARGETIGFLARDVAKDYFPALQTLAGQGKRATCRAIFRGGTAGRPSIGVWLDLVNAETLAGR